MRLRLLFLQSESDPESSDDEAFFGREEEGVEASASEPREDDVTLEVDLLRPLELELELEEFVIPVLYSRYTRCGASDWMGLKRNGTKRYERLPSCEDGEHYNTRTLPSTFLLSVGGYLLSVLSPSPS